MGHLSGNLTHYAQPRGRGTKVCAGEGPFGPLFQTLPLPSREENNKPKATCPSPPLPLRAQPSGRPKGSGRGSGQGPGGRPRVHYLKTIPRTRCAFWGVYHGGKECSDHFLSGPLGGPIPEPMDPLYIKALTFKPLFQTPPPLLGAPTPPPPRTQTPLPCGEASMGKMAQQPGCLKWAASTWSGCSVRIRRWPRLPHGCHRPLSDGHCSAAGGGGGCKPRVACLPGEGP